MLFSNSLAGCDVLGTRSSAYDLKTYHSDDHPVTIVAEVMQCRVSKRVDQLAGIFKQVVLKPSPLN